MPMILCLFSLHMPSDSTTDRVHTVTEDYGYLDTNRVFEITPTEASYVRILVKERCDLLPGGGINGYIAEISEIEVYA